MDLRTFLHVLRRRAGLVLVTIIGVTLVAAGGASMRPETVTAATTLRARTTGAVTEGTVRADAVEYVDRLRSTYVDLVEGRSFRDALAERLDVRDAPDPFVDVSSDSELFEVGVESADRALAPRAADAAASLLIETVRSQDELDLRLADEQFAIEQGQLQQDIDQIQSELANLAAAPDGDPEAEREIAQLDADLDVRLAATGEHAAGYATWRRQQVDRARSLSVMSPANDVESTGPATAVLVGAGVLAGLLAGLGVALVAENLSDEVGTPDAASAVLGAPLLGVLAPDGRARRWRTTMASPGTTSGALGSAALRLADDPSDDVWLVLADSPAAARSTASGLAGTMARFGRRTAILEAGNEPVRAPDGQIVQQIPTGAEPGQTEIGSSSPAAGLPGRFRLAAPEAKAMGAVSPPVVDKAVVRLKERHELVVVQGPTTESGPDWAVFASVVPFVVFVLEDVHSSRTGLAAIREQIEGMGGRIVGVLHASRRRFPLTGAGR